VCRRGAQVLYVAINFRQHITWLVITKIRSASFGLVLHAKHIFANSFNFLVTWGLLITVFHSICIFCVHGVALYWPTLQFYVCVYVSFVCRHVAPLGECYYNIIMLRRIFFIVECGITRFLCAMRVFEVRASSSSVITRPRPVFWASRPMPGRGLNITG